MKIYIDFDDVICETAKYFTLIANELYNIDVPYEKVKFFDLKKSFGLNDEDYDELMRVGHIPERMLSYEETNGASETINKWLDDGHEIFIITGRPYSSYNPSRQWLDEHGLERVPMYCVDKYGRDIFTKNATYSMTLEDLYKMNFDFAVEDSPNAFEHVSRFENCRVAVFNRPWNLDAKLPDNRFERCGGWQEIDRMLEKNLADKE